MEKAAKTKPDGKLLVFTYETSKISMSGLASNFLLHTFKDKVVIIARDTGEEMICSFRAPNSLNLNLEDVLKPALEGLKGRFGGHSKACGGNISKEDFWVFIDRLKKEINKRLK